MADKIFGKGFDSYTPAEQARLRIARETAEEGMVLLENDGVLPLKKGARLAVFGTAQINFLTGGSGSGATESNYTVTIPEALSAAGFELYAPLLAAYTDFCARQAAVEAEERAHNVFMKKGTAPDMPLSAGLAAEAAAFADTAVVVLSRMAGEGSDRAAAPGDYYLSELERDILSKVRGAFSKTVVLLNIAGVIDMGWADEFAPSAVLVTWLPGQEGADALADILAGNINPSGKLADTVAKNYMDHPSSHNFGSWIDGWEDYTGDENQVKYWGMIGNHSEVPLGETVRRPIGNRWFTEYQEGVYVGYRYFGTFGVAPRYPFGYGLSYTTFALSEARLSSSESGVRLSLRVTNTGALPGKEVVQVYFHGAEGPLERPNRELAAFQKTRLLNPGESEAVDLFISKRELSAYSEKKAAWLLQAGDYEFFVGTSAGNCAFAGSAAFGEEITEQVENHFALVHTRPLRQLSKCDPEGTAPCPPEIRCDGGEKMGEPKPPVLFEIPELRQAQYKLADVKSGACSMEAFLSQMADIELACLLVGTGMGMGEKEPVLGPLSVTVPHAGGHTATIPRLGIPTMVFSDGPAGIGAGGKANRIAFPTAQVTASSWNTELARRLGDAIGGEAEENGVDIWLAPAMNIHRNPLCGRNYEYFSEDPVLSGRMAAALTLGAQAHGVSACLKHFAVNNQETNRFDGVDAVATERAIREIYLKGFEIAVRTGCPRCVMTSYNSINGAYASTRRDLVTDVLREEWGFDGFVVTDWEGDGPYALETLRAGNDLLMPGFPGQIKYVLEKLRSGELSRSDAEKCAANILRAVMSAARFEP